MYNAWINPSGKIYEVGYMCHSQFGYEYFYDNESVENQFEVYRDKHMGASSTDFLESLNWKRVLTWQGVPTTFITADDPKSKWSNSQIKAVVDICLELEIEIPERFKGE